MEPLHCPRCGNQLISRPENGYERRFCAACDEFIYENPVPVVAGVIQDEKQRILLIKRGVEPCEGKWSLPTGFIEIGEHPDECVIREVKEETNLDCAIGRFFGVYQQEGWKYRSVIVLAYVLAVTGGEPRAGDDAVDIRYYSSDELPDIPFLSHRHIIHDILKDTGKIEQ